MNSFLKECISDDLTTIAVDGVLVEAAVGHFDPENPGVGEQFLDGAATYAARYAGLDAAIGKIKRAAERAGLRDFAPKSIFDAGSGPGNSIIAEARLFPNARIISSDLSPNMVVLQQFAIEEEGISYRVSPVVADASKVKLVPGAFDLVIGSSMLHHLQDPFQALEGLLAGLAPGGIAVFYEPFQAGNVMLRQCLAEVLRRIPEHKGAADSMEHAEELLKTFIVGFDLMLDESRSHPVIRHLDDKWMFTRAQFEGVAQRLEWERPIITSMNPLIGTWEDKLRNLLFSKTGRHAAWLPDWVIEIFTSCDRFISPALREELLMEGEIIFKRPSCSVCAMEVPFAPS